MSFTIGVTGKGGVGKTTFTALLIKTLIEKKLGVILAVDADPNHNLNEKLGVEVENTIGNLREDIIKDVDSIPPSMSKQEYVEYHIQLALTEAEDFDLLVMGRQEGPGCYCYINNILRTYIDTLSSNYDYIVIDNEAGMEHLSRRTTKRMDVLFIITDASKIGIETSGRIKELAKKMELKIGKFFLVINRAPKELPDIIKENASKSGFNEILEIPYDEVIENYNMEGKSLLGISGDSHTYDKLKELVAKTISKK
jgi:CO dehydrogenase maturation factor